MVIRLNENSSISKRHSGSDNLDEEAKEMVTLDCALAKIFFFLVSTFSCNITRHGATRMTGAGCDDIKYL